MLNGAIRIFSVLGP